MKDINFIWPVILFLLGLLMLINPKLLWKIENCFTVKDGEPTDLYLTLMRLGGIFFIGAGFVVFVVSFI